MSEPGVFYVDREEIFGDDSIFADERFSKLTAYVWLTAYGPVTADLRSLARKWKWTPQEVASFLEEAADANLVQLNGSFVSVCDGGLS